MRVRIATLTGSLTDFSSFMIRAYSLWNVGVHTEIWLDDYRVGAYGCEGNEHTGCIVVHKMVADRNHPDQPIPPDGSSWHVQEIPITDPQKALDFIQLAKDARVPYGINILECPLPKVLLDEFEDDVDCLHPDTWDKVFCSQFALLFLRWCDKHDILAIDKARTSALWAVNSRGCIPSRLKIITDAMCHFQPKT